MLKNLMAHLSGMRMRSSDVVMTIGQLNRRAPGQIAAVPCLISARCSAHNFTGPRLILYPLLADACFTRKFALSSASELLTPQVTKALAFLEKINAFIPQTFSGSVSLAQSSFASSAAGDDDGRGSDACELIYRYSGDEVARLEAERFLRANARLES